MKAKFTPSLRRPALLCVIAAYLTSPCYGLSAPVSKSYVKLTEPETGCEVILLGCLHGSVSSAQDVRELLEGQSTNAVVLELCASRLADLRRSRAARQEHLALQRYGRMIKKTNEAGGFGTALAAAVLGGVSGLQTALSGFSPGLEFVTAMDICEEQGCDLVLADRSVDETLRKIGKLPSISLSMLQSLFQRRSWDATLGKDASALRDAVWGDSSMMDEQVMMLNVLTRNRQVMSDLARSTLPPLILSIFMVGTFNHAMELIFPVEQVSGSVSWSLSDFLSEFLLEAALLAAAYLLVALPAVRVVLCERDEQLVHGIREACRLSEKGRVVAILGLLHVNGVAKQLLTASKGRDAE